MLRQTPLGPPGADGGDVGLEPLLLRPVRLGRQLHEGVQGDLHPRALALVQVVEVGEDAADDGLVRDDDDVLAALELHDDGLEADDDVAVALAAAVPVVVLVVVARAEVLGVLALNLLVRHAVADARLELVERLPLQLLPPRLGREVARRLDRALQRRRPDGQRRVFGDPGLAHQARQGPRVQLAALRDVGVTANFAVEIVLRFAVLDGLQFGWAVLMGRWSGTYSREPYAAGLDVEVLEVVDKTGGEVVWDAVDEDLMSAFTSA